MKAKVFLVVMGVLVIALLLVLTASADDGYPRGVEVFTADGATCVLVYRMGNMVLDCFCPCACIPAETPTVEQPTPYSTETPPTGTPETPTPETPTPETPLPETPTLRALCNRGIGNGSEDCDPGNSYGQGHGHQSGEDVGE